MIDAFPWRNTDPRHEINKRATIVIIRPIGNHLYGGTAYVDTKEGWSICTDIPNHEHIGVDDEWDTTWFWTWAPRLEQMQPLYQPTKGTNQ